MEADERNNLIEKYMVWAEKTAKKFYRQRKIPDALYADYEDILQEAYLGLVKAAENIKQEENSEAYVCIRARGEIVDAIRKNSWKSRYFVSKEIEVQDAITEMERHGIMDPTDIQIAEKIGTSEREIQKIKQTNKIVVSLDGMLDDNRADKNRNESLIGFEESPEQIIEKRDELEHIQQWIRRKIAHYPNREKKILEEHFFEEKSLKQIADELIVSESRICQILNRRLNMLKKSIKIDKESEEVEKYIRRFEQRTF